MAAYAIEIIIAVISMLGTASGAYFANKKVHNIRYYELFHLTHNSVSKFLKWGEIRESNPCITEPQSAVLTTYNLLNNKYLKEKSVQISNGDKYV